MRSALARLAALFVEPPAADPAPEPVFLPPTAGARPDGARATAGSAPSGSLRRPPGVPAAGTASRAPAVAAASRAPAAAALQAPAAASYCPAAAVLGAPAVAVPVAAACAGELRARAGAPAALLCIWRPAARPPGPETEVPAPPAASPAGATTPGARRLAARLAAHGQPVTACGRLAWLALEPEPAPAATRVARCVAIAQAPVVLAIAGPRPASFEPLLAGTDLALVVLPPEADAALRELTLATLAARERLVVAPLAPGPPRWAAMAGLARLRTLPREPS